jgi:hypothetical protein
MTKRLLPLLLLVCPAVFGQTDSGTIRVLVLDASSSIGEAAVELTNVATGVSTSHNSDAGGYASFSPVDGSVPANPALPAVVSDHGRRATVALPGTTHSGSSMRSVRSRGWYTLASYTFYSAIDETGAWGANSSPQYLDDFTHEQGPQTQTSRQRFTLSNVLRTCRRPPPAVSARTGTV